MKSACPIPWAGIPASHTEIQTLPIDRKALPKKAFSDALHIAVTTVHHIPAIASYNFRHIAGAFSRRLIEQTLQQLGYVSPVIASPEDIVGGMS